MVPNPKAIETLARELNRDQKPLKELCQDQKIIKGITDAITAFGLKCGLNKMEIPSKVYLVSDDWSPDSGLVTAALKLRRKNIQDYYRLEIQRLYSNENGSGI